MGCPSPTPEVLALVERCLSEIHGKLSYKVCYGRFEKEAFCEPCDGESLPFGSRTLSRNLRDCDSFVLFAATVGIGMDRLISRYGKLSPVKALCFQAIGAERIESLCSAFNADVRREGKRKGLRTRPRYSPGYGDFPLETQRVIFDLLDCSRKIGLSLNDSLLMSPSKSVTAVIGLSPLSAPNGETGPCAGEGERNPCTQCNKRDCSFREE